MKGAFARVDWDKPRFSKTKNLGQDKVGEVRKDRIKRRDHNVRKKLFSKREPHLDWQSAVVSDGGSQPRIKNI